MRKKLIVGAILFLIILFGYSITSEAAMIVSNKTVDSEEQFSISITSDVSLISYTVVAEIPNGITLVNSSGGAGAGTATISNALQSGSTTQMATYTFKAPKVEQDTQYKITFKATGMGKEDYSKVDNDTKTVVVTVEAPDPKLDQNQNQNQQQPTKPDPEPQIPVKQEPNFKAANKTMYASIDNMRLRATWSTDSEATPVSKGTELKVTATSTNKVNDYVWYKVTYSGKTYYVASNLLTDEKPEEDKPVEEPVEEPKTEEPAVTTQEPEIDETDAEAKTGLKSLEVEGQTLTPTFKSNVYEYRIILKEDVNELKINPIPAVEGATVAIAGDKNLQEGENLITLMVYNENNAVEATYQITVNKNTADLSKTDKLLQAGNSKATRNLMIFIAVLVIAIIGLIAVIVLKRKKQIIDEDYGENYEAGVEFSTEDDQIVENTAKEVHSQETEVENLEEPQPRRKHEKRKGKHF